MALLNQRGPAVCPQKLRPFRATRLLVRRDRFRVSFVVVDGLAVCAEIGGLDASAIFVVAVEYTGIGAFARSWMIRRVQRGLLYYLAVVVISPRRRDVSVASSPRRSTGIQAGPSRQVTHRIMLHSGPVTAEL